MSAQAILSAIAPLSGATTPPATAATDAAVSGEFAMMVSAANDEATVAVDGAALDITAEAAAAMAPVVVPTTTLPAPLIIAPPLKAGPANDTAGTDAEAETPEIVPTIVLDVTSPAGSDEAEGDEAQPEVEANAATETGLSTDAAARHVSVPVVPTPVPAAIAPLTAATSTIESEATAAAAPGAPPAGDEAAAAVTPQMEQTGAAPAPAAVATQAATLPPLKDAPRNAADGKTSDRAEAVQAGKAETAVAIATAPTAKPTPASEAAAPALAVAPRADAAPIPPVADTAPAAAELFEGAALAAPAEQAPATREALTTSTLSRATVETTAQIAAQILRRLEGRQTRFDMVLTPEDLGRVDVSLDIDSEGRLAARLAFDNPAAAADLRGRADELRRQLQEAGFHLAGDALDFAERDSGASNGGAFDRRQDRAFSFAGGKRLTAEADAALARPAWINLSLTPDRVDMKV